MARVRTIAKSDDELVGSARRKEKVGERITAREREALNRHQKETDERERDRLFATCPKRVYLEWSNTTAKIALEHGERFNFPIAGRTVDVRAVLKRLHSFIRENRFKLAADDDPLMSGDNSANLEIYRKWKAKLAELEYYRRLGNWIPREDVHVGLAECAAIVRRAGETLQRQFGPDAREVIEGALEEFRTVILVRFADSTKGMSEGNGDENGPAESKRHRPSDKRSRRADS